MEHIKRYLDLNNMKKMFLLFLFLIFYIELKPEVNKLKHYHSIIHESIIYSHDNEPFDLKFKIQYEIIDTLLSVDSANILVLNEFDSTLVNVIHEHDKVDFFDEDKRDKILDKLMEHLWDNESRYIIKEVEINDLSKNH